jgi:hypothetical protein
LRLRQALNLFRGWARTGLDSFEAIATSVDGSQSTASPRIRLRPPFEHRTGLCWTARLPRKLAWPSDSMETPVGSCLGLAENNELLGPCHAQHGSIEAEGRGRYSHWNGTLLFSTTDGSDPNANGRVYRVFRRLPTIRMLAFGGCNLHAAVQNLEVRGLAYSERRVPVLTFTPREVLQLVRSGFGELEVPDAFRPFAAWGEEEAGSLPAVAAATDCVFLEFIQAIDVQCGDVGLVRSSLYKSLVATISRLGTSERRIARRWYQHGLIQRDETVRIEAGAQLLDWLPRINVDQAVGREILMHARGSIQSADQVAAAIRQIIDILGVKHVCVITSPNLYMPDGRPVVFPVDFPNELRRVCQQLDLPLFSLSELVAARGGTFALKGDLNHFTPQFRECYGDELLAMSRRTIARNSAGAEQHKHRR